MPRLTLTINGHPITVYHKNDVWRGGMVAFGRAERSHDDYGPRRLVKTAEVSGYYQSEHLLEDQTLVMTWYDLKPEPIAEMVGPEPSSAWAKGTITTTAGSKHQLEYKLSPHTKEQAEKVFRERLIEQAGKPHTTPDDMTDQLRSPKQMVSPYRKPGGLYDLSIPHPYPCRRRRLSGHQNQILVIPHIKRRIRVGPDSARMIPVRVS